MTPSKTIYEAAYCDQYAIDMGIDKAAAEQVFDFFKNNPLFRWQDANNDCEDRANAITLLLDAWGVPNYKVWVFSAPFIRKGVGSLVNCWNYHVAAALPVHDEGGVSFHAIDPATSEALNTIEIWAHEVTQDVYSYHIIKESGYYIFPPTGNLNDCWFERDRQNYKWTIQGLSGINGVSRTGKAQLVFNKQKISKTELAFKELLRNKPSFLK